MKNVTKQFTDQLVKENKGKNLLVKTNLLSVQFSNSDKDAKQKLDLEALENRLSIIDFSKCEKYLRKNGYLRQNENIKFSKTDWNPALMVDEKSNKTANVTKSAAVTYDLFAENGTKIDRNLCVNTTTDIKIPIKNFDKLGATGLEYDPFNPKSDYFNDICIPMKKNETAATINDRRKEFKGLNLTCSGGCNNGKVNTSTGYLSCKCNSSNSKADVSPKFETAVMEIINQTNIYIAQCFFTAFKIVNIIYKFSLISIPIWDFMKVW